MLATLRYDLELNQGVLRTTIRMSHDQLGPLHLNQLYASWPLLSIYESGRGAFDHPAALLGYSTSRSCHAQTPCRFSSISERH
jgi:hypothetical protein